jgi:hypothetical protein
VPDDWGSRVGEDLKPDSWGKCVELLLGSGGGETIYRGHRCFEWKLESTLERALQEHAQRWDADKYQLMLSASADPETERWADDVESWLTEFFRRNALRFGMPDLPEPSDTLGWWEVMQHHRAPTRLLDWTRSPFIAVWFALEECDEESGDMALWIYDRRNARLNHLDAEKESRQATDGGTLDDRRLQNRFVQLAIADGNPALIPVVPRQFPRSVAQQSMLTVSPTISVGRPANWWIRSQLASRIRLRTEWREEMRAACSSLGLSRPGLYRDLDSLGEYVSTSFRDRTQWVDPT